MFSQKPVAKSIAAPVQKKEVPKAPVVTKTDIENLEVKKLKAIYLALKKSGRYNQSDLLRIEKRLKDLS